MARGGPRVTLTFAGEVKNLKKSISQVDGLLKGVGKGFAALASSGGAVNVIGGAVGAVTALSGAALLLPGALLAGGAAMGTLKLATAGFGEALSSMSDPAKFAEAIKDMAPAAQQTAIAIRSMQPQMKALKQEVQGRFFEGFADQAKQLGKTYLPILGENMGAIAGRMNLMARSAGSALMHPAAVSDVNEVFNATIATLGNMRGALANVISGVLGLGAVGATYLPALGTGIQDATNKFKAWVDQGVESGRIKEIIDAAILAFQDLGAIVGSVGSFLGSVFTGLGGSTASFLTPLKEMTAKLAEWAASPAAQEMFTALGEAMRAAGTLLREVLLSALNTLTPIISGLAPHVTTIATKLSEWSGFIGPLVVGMIGLAGVIKVVQAGIATWTAIQSAARIATMLWTGVQWALNAAFLANPITWVVALVVGLVAAIIYAWHNCETFRNVVKAVWEGIKAAFRAGIDWIKGAIQWFGQLPGKIGGWIGQAKDAIVRKFTEAVAWVRGLPGRFLGALGNLGSTLLGAGRSLVDGFLSGIRGAWDRVVGFVRQGMQWLRNLWPFSPAKTGPFSGTGYVTHSGKALTTDFAASLRKGMPNVAAAASDVLGAAHGGLNANVRVGRVPGGVAGTSGGARTVDFAGNVDQVFAAAFQKLVRTGQIVIT